MKILIKYNYAFRYLMYAFRYLKVVFLCQYSNAKRISFESKVLIETNLIKNINYNKPLYEYIKINIGNIKK